MLKTKLVNTFNLIFFMAMTVGMFYIAAEAVNATPQVKQGIIKTVNGQGANY